LKLRDKLFLTYSCLTLALLAAAAWVIDTQVVAEARRQVQEQMKSSLPLYEAVWEEQSGRLAAAGMAMAGSPVAKTIFGDPRASRDAETIRQMLTDFGQQLSRDVDLVLVTDGGGNVVFCEDRSQAGTAVKALPTARIVAERQKPAESFEIVDGRLFHLALSPVLSHSGSESVNNTLVVLVAGSELNRRMAEELKRRAQSDVLFFAGSRLYSSSLAPEIEATAARTLQPDPGPPPAEPVEAALGGEAHLAFFRPLASIGRQTTGHVVVLHSLGAAGSLFRAISGRLFLLGALSLAAALLISYVVARRVTRPIEALARCAREFGKGVYDAPVDLNPGGEVGQLAYAFEQMRLSVRDGQTVLLRNERLATIGKMASGIIHDLRSPLAAISTAAELFARELPPEKRKILAENQLQASRRMEVMLRELLEFARGNYVLKIERVELSGLLQAATGETMSSSLVRGLEADVQVPPHLFVQADSERLRRLFTNLLVNSVQAMPEGGTIRVRATCGAGIVRINVADTGAGIPVHLRDRLFEPFASHGKPGGTGLGLAIANSIAQAHGGSLKLVSAIGESADFCVELPIAAKEEERNA
jgi:signal transduction histidine kinase